MFCVSTIYQISVILQVNNETDSFLATALSYVQRKDTDEDTSLTAGMAIPSHEEVNSEIQSPAVKTPSSNIYITNFGPRSNLIRQLMGIPR